MYRIPKNVINEPTLILDKHSKINYDDENNEDKGMSWSHGNSHINAWSTIPISPQQLQFIPAKYITQFLAMWFRPFNLGAAFEKQLNFFFLLQW